MRTPGVTWDFRRNLARRGVLALAVAGVCAVSVPMAGAEDAKTTTTTAARTRIVLSPVWADPLGTSTASRAPLGSLAEVEQVIGAQRAWAHGFTGQGVDVAVIDTGVTPVAGLNAPGKVIYGPDLSFDSQDPSTAYLDGYGHGTAMAGIIAGDDDNGFSGVAPDARVLSVRVGSRTGAVDVTQIIAAIDWVVQHRNTDGLNVRVLNLSLGTDSLQDYQLDPLAHAAEVAWRHGIVVVAAIGNDGTEKKSVASPASDPYLLAVGAEDPNGTRNIDNDFVPEFSSRGNARRHADVVAPGTSIVSLRVPGSTLDTLYPGARVGDRFFRGSGTSQATAMVSGAAAVMLSQRPELTPDQVKGLLMGTARPIQASREGYDGKGVISLPDAMTERARRATQDDPISYGNGSLEAARGNMHVAFGDAVLTGERDIFGNPYDAAQQARLEEQEQAWSGSNWSGATWSGNTWTGATWSGATWSGSNWSGATWSGATWSGATWSGATWSGATWSGATWSGATWSGTHWG